MAKAILFDIDHTLYNREHAHTYAISKVFSKIHKLTWTKISLLKILYDLSRKEIHRQLAGHAASHNKELHLQKMFEPPKFGRLEIRRLDLPVLHLNGNLGVSFDAAEGKNESRHITKSFLSAGVDARRHRSRWTGIKTWPFAGTASPFWLPRRGCRSWCRKHSGCFPARRWIPSQ